MKKLTILAVLLFPLVSLASASGTVAILNSQGQETSSFQIGNEYQLVWMGHKLESGMVVYLLSADKKKVISLIGETLLDDNKVSWLAKEDPSQNYDVMLYDQKTGETAEKMISFGNNIISSVLYRSGSFITYNRLSDPKLATGAGTLLCHSSLPSLDKKATSGCAGKYSIGTEITVSALPIEGSNVGMISPCPSGFSVCKFIVKGVGRVLSYTFIKK